MTATQAPTPGPLSVGNLHTAIMEALAEDIQRQRPDAFREEDENGFEGDVIIPTGATPQSAFAKVNVSDLAEVILPLLAPTAPVEASGSEREYETAEAMAEAWSDRVEIQRMVETTSAVFSKWASPELLSRFRQQMMAVIQQAYIEGAAEAAPASPLPGGGQCSGISGELKSLDLDALEKLADEATPGPWIVQDGCSWRRIGTRHGDGDVLCPINHHRDNHPDLTAGRGHDTYANLNYIAAANPATIKALIAELKEAKGCLHRFEWSCEQLARTRSQASYDQMISDGQAQELLELDNARRAARAFLARNGKGEG